MGWDFSTADMQTAYSTEKKTRLFWWAVQMFIIILQILRATFISNSYFLLYEFCSAIECSSSRFLSCYFFFFSFLFCTLLCAIHISSIRVFLCYWTFIFTFSMLLFLFLFFSFLYTVMCYPYFLLIQIICTQLEGLKYFIITILRIPD